MYTYNQRAYLYLGLEIWNIVQFYWQSHRQIWAFWTFFRDVKIAVGALMECHDWNAGLSTERLGAKIPARAETYSKTHAPPTQGGDANKWLLLGLIR